MSGDVITCTVPQTRIYTFPGNVRIVYEHVIQVELLSNAMVQLSTPNSIIYVTGDWITLEIKNEQLSTVTSTELEKERAKLIKARDKYLV